MMSVDWAPICQPKLPPVSVTNAGVTMDRVTNAAFYGSSSITPEQIFAEKYKSHGDRHGLQIDIWADNLSPGLHLIDEVVQRFSTCVSEFLGLDQYS